ncbi:hypothetical protein BGZ82_007918 [Podila clonocystis]|nr:hypothetical protein BGZ82_007918 [Podila clonocystis]
MFARSLSHSLALLDLVPRFTGTPTTSVSEPATLAIVIIALKASVLLMCRLLHSHAQSATNRTISSLLLSDSSTASTSSDSNSSANKSAPIGEGTLMDKRHKKSPKIGQDPLIVQDSAVNSASKPRG